MGGRSSVNQGSDRRLGTPALPCLAVTERSTVAGRHIRFTATRELAHPLTRAPARSLGRRDQQVVAQSRRDLFDELFHESTLFSFDHDAD